MEELTCEQVAEELQVSVQRARALARGGHLQARRTDAGWLVASSSVEQWKKDRPPRRGPRGQSAQPGGTPLEEQVKALTRENDQLRERLRRAEVLAGVLVDELSGPST